MDGPLKATAADARAGLWVHACVSATNVSTRGLVSSPLVHLCSSIRSILMIAAAARVGTRDLGGHRFVFVDSAISSIFSDITGSLFAALMSFACHFPRIKKGNGILHVHSSWVGTRGERGNERV